DTGTDGDFHQTHTICHFLKLSHLPHIFSPSFLWYKWYLAIADKLQLTFRDIQLRGNMPVCFPPFYPHPCLGCCLRTFDTSHT
ncbi:mCG145421, partial [Mus musculus]